MLVIDGGALRFLCAWRPGTPSGFVIYNAQADTLTPLTLPTPADGDFIGHFSVAISPNGQRAIITWMQHPTDGALNVSIIDLAALDGPIDPTTLTNLWTTTNFRPTFDPVPAWTSNDRIAISTYDPLRTVVLQLETP